MSDKKKKGFKWKTFSLLAYLFATAVGYLYATGYYGNFGIDILNYVEPIDFLFISLDNVNEVLTFSGLIVPFVLPSIILILVGSISFGLIVVLISLAAYLSFVFFLCSGSLLILAVIAALARHVTDQVKWIWKALRATFGRQRDTEKERPRTFADKFRRLGATCQKLGATYKEMAKTYPSKPTEEIDYLIGSKKVILEVPNIWSWIPKILQPIRNRTRRWMGGFFESESSWRPKGWTSLGRRRQLVVLVILAYIGAAAYVNGEFNAQTIRSAESAASSDGAKHSDLNNAA